MVILYAIYEIFIIIPVAFVLTLLAAFFTAVGCSCGFGKVMGYWPGVIWAKCICWLCLSPYKVEGRENIDKHTSYIFVANHQGAFDIFLLYAGLGHSFRWMLRKGIRKMPFVGYACDKAGHIWVDEHGASGMMHTVRQALQTLKGDVTYATIELKVKAGTPAGKYDLKFDADGEGNGTAMCNNIVDRSVVVPTPKYKDGSITVK